MTQLYQICKF